MRCSEVWETLAHLVGVFVWFTENFESDLRIASYLILVHCPNQFIYVLSVKQRTLFCYYFIWTFNIFLSKIRWDFGFSNDNFRSCIENFSCSLFLTLTNKPLSCLREIIIRKMKSFFTLFSCKVTIKTVVKSLCKSYITFPILFLGINVKFIQNKLQNLIS